MFYEELFTKASCSCCGVEISGLAIECCECTTTFRLCTECFSLGAEVGQQHKAEHKYRFFDSGSLVIFAGESNWSAREEIRLLDAIEQYGFGNWQDISKHIETKTSNEAKDEYVKRFVQGTTGQATWATSTNKEKVQRPVDYTCRDDGPLSPSLTQKLPPLDIAVDEAAQLGYMPQRDDYEKEFDNDAEKLVSQLVFSTEDEEVDIALKLALVDIYSRRLRERARRKRVIRDYQLVSQFFKKDRPSQKRLLLPSCERELQEQFKPFAQFHTAREHENFIQNLIKEKDLIFRLGECYKYHRNGITRVSECAEFERLKTRKRAQVQSSSSTGGTNNSTDTKPSISKPDSSERLPDTESADELSGAEDELTSDSTGNADSYRRKKKRRRGLLSRQKTHSPAVLMRRLQLKMRGISIRGAFITNNRAAADPGARVRGRPRLLAAPRKKPEKPKDMVDPFTANVNIKSVPVNSLPSSQLLSSPEKNLCVSANLQPSQYLTIKTALLLSQSPVKYALGRPSNLTDLEWNKVVSFITSGWISSHASEAE